MATKHLLFLVSEDWYFLSHRLPVARAARDAGYRVSVACRVTAGAAAIQAEGFRLLPIDFERAGTNPARELRVLARLVALYRRERPDLVHHVAMKPVLYGSIAAWLAGVPAVVNALAGLGYLYTSPSVKARALRPVLVAAFRLLLNRPGSRLIVQNADDRALFADTGIVDPSRLVVIRGSGVDVDLYAPSAEPAGPPVAVLVARMLTDKGVREAVEAARRLKESGVALRVVLVGDTDPANPRAIPRERLEGWNRDGVVEWWGHRADIASIWRHAHIALLPSYREGLPKSLLEAAASGRPAVATDVPGCRELVADGVNGLLVPPRDPAALAEALGRLAADAGLRRRMGAEARRVVVEGYSDRAVAAATLSLYHSLIDPSGTFP